MQRGQVVLVDTNIIIEAVRTSCWNAIGKFFALETVGKCLEEARTGDPLRRNYVKVESAQLKAGISKEHEVTVLETTRLALALPSSDELDRGERDLMAHALGRSDAWMASCADRAALKAIFRLGWKDRVVSLETLARAVGARPDLKAHFCERWLADRRTDFLLDAGLS